MAVRNPLLGPPIAIRVTWREKFVSLRELWPVGVLTLLVIGGIYGGVFSPTEAGAVGAAAALIIALVRKGLTWSRLRSAMVETVEFTCTLILTLIGAMIFARFLAISGFGANVSELLMGLDVPPMIILIGLVCLSLLMGCFIDAVSIMAITLPIVFTPILEMGFDPTWLGIVLVLVLTTGALTPPFGLAVFIIKAAAGDDMSVVDVFRGSFLFFVLLLIAAAIMIAFPQISLFLPNMRQGL
jgi:tripartite ATP-independent transporter DctM subunit